MNRKQRLEARVVAVVNRVLAGGRAEDDLVECKSALIAPEKAARRIAGQANAARGETFIWIVGLDEDSHKLTPLPSEDPADWWAKVEARFSDQISPDAMWLNVPVSDSESVLALEFETDRAPYVVTTNGAGGVDREVPWRTATSVRTAKRHELLSILAPAVHVPTIELVNPKVVATFHPAVELGDVAVDASLRVTLNAQVLFVVSEPCFLPQHLWSLTIQFGNTSGPLSESPIWSDNHSESAIASTQILGAFQSKSGLFVNSSDVIWLRSDSSRHFSSPLHNAIRFAPEVICKLAMPVGGSDRLATAEVRLASIETEQPMDVSAGYQILGTWALQSG